jgi:hypothetical protein
MIDGLLLTKPPPDTQVVTVCQSHTVISVVRTLRATHRNYWSRSVISSPYT